MPLKIYYLDDEEGLCENFTDYFASTEVEVTTFTDVESALTAIKLMPPDLLFLDFRLIGTTGDEVAKGLDPEFPVFLVTGDISVKTDYCFKGVFSKPYRELEIANVIQSYVVKNVG